MHSHVRILGLPLQPALIPLPFTAFTLALVALLAFAGQRDPFWLRATQWLSLVGVVAGMVAVLAGLLDWALLPATSPAKSSAAIYLALSGAILGLFLASWLLLSGQSIPVRQSSLALPLVCQLSGVLLMPAAGWLGWQANRSENQRA